MGIEVKSVTAVVATGASKRELDALWVWCAKLEFRVTGLHSEVDVAKQLHAEIFGWVVMPRRWLLC